MPLAAGGPADPRGLLTRIFLDVAARIDGGRLVEEAAVRDPAFARATHVLAVGKVAIPMFGGLAATTGDRRAPGAGRQRPALLIAPAPLVAAARATGWGPDGAPPLHVQVLAADHPHPTERSVAAAAATARFVASLDQGGHGDGAGGDGGTARLLVLLSGGASALLCAPADGLGLQDKRDAVAAVARAGATIQELNVVRKHLSAIKGGRLARLTRAPVAVRALSDVIGDDPATIGSGPLSPDPSRFADAVAIVTRLGAALPPAAAAYLSRGAAGALAETPKPGARELDHVDYQVLAGPARVVAEARAALAAAGCRDAGPLALDVEDTVEERAAAVLASAHAATGRATSTRHGDGPHVLVGNGEPRVILSGGPAMAARRGGRATHLALLVARGLAQLPDPLRARVAFLAAGTDDRDGDTDVSGAAVDGTTWARAHALGLNGEAALRHHDSLLVLAAVGDTVRGPGTSNLLDLHLLLIA